MLLGELGGVYGVIVSLPSYFIASFVERIFMDKISSLIPVKD